MKHFFTTFILALTLLCGSTLNVAAASQSWSGTKTLSNGDNITDSIILTGHVTIRVSVGDTATINGPIIGDYRLIKMDPGMLILNGNKTYTGKTTVGGGTLQVRVSPYNPPSSPGIAFQTSSISVADAALLVFDVLTNGRNPFIFSKVIEEGTTGSRGVCKKGTGTLVLTAANTYTGTTTVEKGTLKVGNGATNGSISYTAGVVLDSGTTLLFNLPDDLVFDKPISGDGRVRFVPQFEGQVFSLMGNHSYTGTTTLEGVGELYIYGAIVGDISADTGSTLGLLPSGDWVYNGVISGDAGVAVGGGNIVTFAQAQAYTGGTYIGDATLAIGEYGSIYSSSGVGFTHADGKFDISGYGDDGVVDVKRLTSARTNTTAEVIVGNNHLEVGTGFTGADMGSYAGKITGDGNGSIGKSSNGKWNFLGTVSYLQEMGAFKGSLQLSSDIDCRFWLNSKVALLVDGSRTIDGVLAIGDSSIVDFDLTVTTPSKLTITDTTYFNGANAKILLRVKADTEGAYDLIVQDGVSADKFVLELTGAWTDGELIVSGNKLQLVPPTISVTGVTLNKTSLTLKKGAAETLVATIAPSDASNKAVTWASSNSAVATVSESGKVSAIALGTATITVTTDDGGKTATCAVTVSESTASEKLANGEHVKVYITAGTLCIDSPEPEHIDIYSVSGSHLKSVEKAGGQIYLAIDNLPQGVIIVRGSSGWVKKIMR